MRTKVKLYNYGSYKYLENFVLKDEYEKDKEKLKNKFDSKFVIYNPEKKKYLRHFIRLSGMPIFTEKLENAKLFDNLVDGYKARKVMIEYTERFIDKNTNVFKNIYNKDKTIINIDVNQIIFCWYNNEKLIFENKNIL